MSGKILKPRVSNFPRPASESKFNSRPTKPIRVVRFAPSFDTAAAAVRSSRQFPTTSDRRFPSVERNAHSTLSEYLLESRENDVSINHGSLALV